VRRLPEDLGQALGGAASGGAKQAPDFLAPQDEQDGVDEGGLADATLSAWHSFVALV
jgi:hypothetical protein